MVLEANPGGAAKYYHLYNGSIPLSAVISERSGHALDIKLKNRNSPGIFDKFKVVL